MTRYHRFSNRFAGTFGKAARKESITDNEARAGRMSAFHMRRWRNRGGNFWARNLQLPAIWVTEE